jgi:hypothetical protein
MFVVSVLLCGRAVLADLPEQQEQPEPHAYEPKPSGRTLLPAVTLDQDSSGEQQSTPPLVPNTQPLTGVQNPTVGTPQVLHSYWVPGFQYINMVASSSLNQTNAVGWNSTSYMLGSISLLQTWGRAQFSVNYSGGGYFSSDGSQGSGFLHQLGLVQTLEWQNWQFEVFDQFSYLPEAAFGFGVGTSISTPGVGGNLAPALPALQNSYQLNQSIFSSVGTRYSNSFTPQAIYKLSRRASINFAGSYGILRFVEAGNIDSDDAIFNVGYNYSLSRRDTIGALYRFTAYRYLGNPQALNDHVLQVAYGREITGRLTLQVFIGPGIATFAVPIGGMSRQPGTSGGAGFRYVSGLNNLAISYTHGLSNGSGILVGATADQVETNIDRKISRSWGANLNFGYARNKSLGNTSGSQNPQAFNAYYWGGGLSRPVNRESNLSLNYSARIQYSNQAFCAAGVCDRSYTEQRISLLFSWHGAPFVLR